MLPTAIMHCQSPQAHSQDLQSHFKLNPTHLLITTSNINMVEMHKLVVKPILMHNNSIKAVDLPGIYIVVTECSLLFINKVYLFYDVQNTWKYYKR